MGPQASSKDKNEIHDPGGVVRERERGSHSTSRGRKGVQLRGPELSISLWELKITGVQKQSCRWQRRGHPVGGGYRCHPGSASLGEREEAMEATVSVKRAEERGGRPSRPSIRGAERRDESKKAAGA